MNRAVLNRAVFFDRDGTLIEEVGFLDHLDRVVLFPWTIDALRLLRREGFKLGVVTNQSGVARGYFDEAFVDTVHARIAAELARGGVTIDRWYFCPHHPSDTCPCRKPRPGMLQQAMQDLQLDLTQSYVVGDRWLDVQLAHNVGATGVLVRTGHGIAEEAQHAAEAKDAIIVPNVMDAASWIVRDVRARTARRPASAHADGDEPSGAASRSASAKV